MTKLHPEWFVTYIDMLSKKGMGLTQFMHRGCYIFYSYNPGEIKFCPKCGVTINDIEYVDKSKFDEMDVI